MIAVEIPTSAMRENVPASFIESVLREGVGVEQAKSVIEKPVIRCCSVLNE
jgi:hypothetical protein